MKLKLSKINKILLFLFLILLPIITIKAANNENEKAVFVASDEIVSGNLLAAGENIIVDGTVSGDLIAAASYITVTGRIEGDIIAIAQDINIEGEVGGNVRVLGNSIFINSAISRNLNAFGPKVTIGKDARIGWDALILGVDTIIRGDIEGDLDSYSQTTLLSGKVGNINLKIYNKNTANGFILDKEAVVNGNLNYSAPEKISINNQDNISGEIIFKELKQKEKTSLSAWLWNRLFSFLSLLFIGLVFVFIIFRFTRKFIFEGFNNTGRSFLWGIIATLIIPPLALLVAFTIIGLPLALILISLWLAGIFIGKALAAILLGSLILKKVFKKEKTHLFWPLILGALTLSLLFSIPWLGWIVNLLAIWLGWGSILSYVTNQSKNI